MWGGEHFNDLKPSHCVTVRETLIGNLIAKASQLPDSWAK